MCKGTAIQRKQRECAGNYQLDGARSPKALCAGRRDIAFFKKRNLYIIFY